MTARELRARAREVLGYRIFDGRWLYAVLAYVLVSAASTAIGYIPWAGWICSILLTGVFSMCLASYFRYVGERGNDEYSSLAPLIEPIRSDLAGSIVLGLLTTVFTLLWTLLFVFPGIVKIYSYSMAYYIKLDHPEYTPNQAITESRKMMNGNKFRLFCLDLSFVGWCFVGILACGIGILWVQPYMEAARYEFYRDLKFDDFGRNMQFFDDSTAQNQGDAI